MATELRWIVTYEQGELIYELFRQHENYEITEDQLLEGLMQIPSCPLSGNGDPSMNPELKIIVQPKVQISVPRTLH